MNNTPLLIASAIVAALLAILIGAYATGVLDPVIRHFVMVFLKAKVRAEKKQLEAKGVKEAEDLLSNELKGHKHAQEVTHQGLSGLKKNIHL